jgi:hypothetical protein
MSRAAVAAVIVSVAGAAAEVMLTWAISAAWFPAGMLAFMLAFLAGSLLFLALLAWRRRNRPALSRLLLWVAVIVAGGGVALLGRDYYLFSTAPPDQRPRTVNPVVLPAVQWAVVFVVWVGLVIQEAWEKRAKGAGTKTT